MVVKLQINGHVRVAAKLQSSGKRDGYCVAVYATQGWG